MMSLGANPLEEDQNKLETGKGGEEANLVMAIKSTPSLNKAFTNIKKITNRTTSQFTAQRDLPTGPSELLESGFAKPANLNVLSQNDLTNNLGLSDQIQMFAMKDKSRPMTTKFADRRMTQQPNSFDENMTTMNPLVQ